MVSRKKPSQVKAFRLIPDRGGIAVSTCFIFAENLNEAHCLSLLINQQGEIEAPLAQRSVHEVRLLQLEAKTIVVLSTSHCGLFAVDMPWLGERKARTAIPYALEEQLAQSVESLHFAFDRRYYQNNSYLVVATDKQYLSGLIAQLDDLELNFDCITYDWFALQANEACLLSNRILVHDSQLKGSLCGELVDVYLKKKPDDTRLVAFKGDNTSDLDATRWIAKRLLAVDLLNLCQGEFQRGNRQQSIKFWYGIAVAMCGVWLACMLLFKGFYIHGLSTRMAVVDDKIAVIYRHFFPNAQQVISPKFRIGQLLNTGNANSNAATLWILLDKLSQSIKTNEIAITEFRFQNQQLFITLSSKNFSVLENLQSKLQQNQVKVKQAQASTEKQQVIATLELSL